MTDYTEKYNQVRYFKEMIGLWFVAIVIAMVVGLYVYIKLIDLKDWVVKRIKPKKAK